MTKIVLFENVRNINIQDVSGPLAIPRGQIKITPQIPIKSFFYNASQPKYFVF